MSKPVYKIEVYDPSGPTLRHTITNDALNVNMKEVITENIGTFSFILPTKQNGDYYYDDIVINDIAKIWFGYDSVSGSANTVGRIYNVSAPLSIPEGYIRIFVGMNQGEVLNRRQKSKKWVATGASTLVTELANDLSLGTGEIQADATSVDLQVLDMPYFSVLQKVSDYWYNAGTQIKKDFYVDVNNNLVWKNRPLRTIGVETLTVGDNIISYNVFRDLKSVKNKIKVYGAQGATFPLNGDSLTEQDAAETPADDGWTSDGTLSWVNTDPKVGNENVNASRSGTTLYLLNSFSSIKCYDKKYYNLHAWIEPYTAVLITNVLVRLYAPDNSNYYERNVLGVPSSGSVWVEVDWPVGPGTEGANTNEGWVATGTPNWGDIQGFFVQVTNNATGLCGSWIDAFYFSRLFYDTAEDATSQSDYGIREYTLVDGNLSSDAECQKRGEAMLYQLKDPPIRLDVATLGNMNVLIGDRISMTIPAENISGVNFDVISVEHNLSVPSGFQTRAIMVNSANRRITPPKTENELLKQLSGYLKEVASGIGMVR